MRIVSLISSATEIVDALGQLDYLVGRSHECDYPEHVKTLPVCTRPRIPIDADSREIDRQVRASIRDSISIYDVFEDLVSRLEPTHILTQIQCDVCAVSLRDVEAAFSRGMRGHPQVVSLQPDSLAGIWDDIRRVAVALRVPEHGEDLVRDLRQRMHTIAAQAASHPTLRVACLEWIEPLMDAGYWIPELISLAGAVPVHFNSAPDVVIVAPCGFDLARTERELYWLQRRPQWRTLRRVYAADGNQFFNRPGPRVAETLAIVMEMLYPQQIAPHHRGRAWRAII